MTGPFRREVICVADHYQIIDGVRRAKAARLAGHSSICAEIVDRNGHITEESQVAIDVLLSPKRAVRRITKADEERWGRALKGAKNSELPFPPILIQPGEKGTAMHDVSFDFGGET